MTTTHQQIEALLDRHQVTYEHHPQLELRRIDLIASVTNQVRHEPIDTDTVERYVAALQEGATFPPILVRRIPPTKPKGKAQLVILGGNHRARAHIDAGHKTIDAYVFECDDLVALEIAFSDNATHGLPPTQAERIAHACTLIDRGRTIAAAAKTVGIGRGHIDKHLNARQVRQRAATIGVADTLETLPATTQGQLVSVKDDRVLARLINIIAEHRIGAGPAGTSRLIRDVNAQPDVASQMDYLQAYVAQLAPNGTRTKLGRPPENPYLQLLTALGTIRGLNPSDTLEHLRGNRDRQDLHDKLLAGARHLMAIDQLLQADNHGPDLRAVR